MVDFIADEERLNVFTQGNQDSLHMAALTGGGYVAVWSSDGQNGTGLGLTAQLYNDLGERVGLPFFIEETTVGNQNIGGVAATADGGFVVTWQTPNTIGILARQFDASGSPTTGEIQVNTETYSTQSQPEVAGLTGGGYVVTWSSVNDETFTNDIRAQRYDATGAAVGGEFTVNTTTAGSQAEPEITALNDGGFVVVWLDQSGADGSSWGVYAQRYDASGVAQGAETLVNTSTAGQQTEQDVVALQGGGYVVVWTDYNGLDGSAGGVFAQIYDATGATVGGQFLINQVTNSWQWEPAVTATADGGFFVSWYGYGTVNGTTYDIVGRHFDATGNALSDEMIINDDGSGSDPRRPDVVGLSNGGIVVGWDYPVANGDGDGRAVYQRMLELDGSGIIKPQNTILEGVDAAITFTETEVQSTPQILDASGAVAVSGPADFDGGKLTVARISARNDELQFNQATGESDDVFGLRDQGTGAGEVGVTGTTVTFGGVVIGTITSDGTDGNPLVITFNANADAAAVEAVAENLTYANASDDPQTSVDVAILLEDGDGGASEPARIKVTIVPEEDIGRPVFANDIDVNTFSNSTQQQPVVTSLADGGWVVMWESYSQDSYAANTYGIVGQRYDASGAPSGPEFLVNTQEVGSQQDVSVSGIDGGANAGGFVAVWYDGNNATEGYVRAQIFDSASQKVGAEIMVPTTVYSTQNEPDVTTFPDGSFAISWSSYRLATSSYDIMVQRFNADGSKAGGEIVANTKTASTQSQPEIATLAGGGFVVAWESFDQGGTNTYDISTRIYDASGNPVTAETLVNTATGGEQVVPDIVGLTGGGYVVVWEDRSGLDGNSYGIYAQRYAADGTTEGGQFLVNENTQGIQGEPVVTALPGGGFAVAYYTTTSAFGGSYNIAIQHYDAAGQRVDGEIKVNQDDASSQYQPGIATLLNGDTVVVWRDDSGRDGSGAGIVMQIVGDAANYGSAQNNPNVTIAESSVSFVEDDVNAGPQILFAGVDVGDADSADFDGGTVSIFRAGAAVSDNRYNAPDDGSQDVLGIRDQGTGAGEIGVSGASVTFGGTVIGTIVSDGSAGTPLTVVLNASATPVAVEAFLQNVTYENPSDDPNTSRDIRVVLTDGDGGSATPVNVNVRIEASDDGFVALNGEIQVNSFQDGSQSQPDVGALASGGYVTVWTSYDQDAGTFDNGIFAQRFDGSGQPVGSEFQINSLTSGNQQEPVVAGLDAADGGGYVVVWSDTSNTSGFIKAQVHNDDGSVRTAEFMVETEVYSTQATPAITAVPGGFLVTWSSVNNETFTNDIRGQYFDGNGVAQGSEFTVNTDVTAGTQYRPDVAADAAGNVVVVWEDQSSQDGSSFGVYGQLIDPTGALVGSQFAVNTITAGGQYQAHVDYLSDGRFVVSWYDDSGLDGSGASVIAQIFDASGTKIGDQFIVNESVSSTQTVRDVLGLSDGGFVIAYDDASGIDGSGWGVVAQQFNADGSRRDGAVVLNEERTSTQSEVRITEITDGTDTGFAAVWTSANSAPAGDGSGNGVFTRIFGEEGTMQPANVMPEIDGLAVVADFGIPALGAPQIIDNSINVTDPDSADFAGGTVELRFIDYRANSDDQLSVVAGKGVTVSGADVLYDGTVIGTIDATNDGVNGQDLVINLNANANADNLRFVLEQLGYMSTNPVGGTERSVSVRVTDGDGGISAGDSIRLDINATSASGAIALNEVNNLSATEAEVEGGVRLDTSVDFNDTLGNGYDGGFVDVGYRTGINNRVTGHFDELFVADLGTGTNQIGVSGTDITYQGVTIGSIDVTLNGQGGSDLRINLVAAATPEAVDALIEAFSYRNMSQGPADEVRFDVSVTDGSNVTTGNRDFNLTITSTAADATVALGDEQQVNAFSVSEQINPAIAELADGGFVVTWQSYNQDSAANFNYGVYQQRYNSEGEPVGPEILVNQTTSGAQDDPDVAGLPGGGWVTVWEGTDNSSRGIWARIYDANGVPGQEFSVNTQQSSNQSLPSVAVMDNGNFVVTWAATTSGGSGDGSGEGIAGRVFDSSGTPVTASDFILNTVTASTQRDVDVAGLDGGGFVAVWESNGVDGDGYGVAFQRFDNNGVAVGSETVVNTTTAGAQDNASVAGIASGGFVVAWQMSDGSSDGIFLQAYDASGAAVGGEVRVNDLASGNQDNPSIIGTSDGGWIVTWNDSSGRDGGGTGVLAQRYAADGTRIDSNFVVNQEFSSTQTNTAVGAMSDGRVAVAWQSTTSGTAGDGSGNGVFVRLFGDASEAQSAAPFVAGLADVVHDEADLNAGFIRVFADGAVSVADSDSADFDGGRLMIHVVRSDAAAEQFKTPDNLSQDVMTFAGTGISISGSNVSVDGVSIGTLEADGQNGNGLQVLLNANATAERVETLLGGLNYRNPSNDPRDSREIEVSLSDGDGGVSPHQTFNINITAETDGLSRIGDEVQVNSFTESTQYRSDVAGLTGGGHVVVWASYQQDNPGEGNYGVFGQRFDVDGQPVGPEFEVNTTFAGGQNNPVVTGLSNGGFVVAWEGNGVGDGSGVFAQLFNADGTLDGTEFRLNENTASSDTVPEITASAAGGFMAVWQSSQTGEIEGRIYDNAGTALGTEFTINAGAGGSKTQPDVTALAGGGYGVTWLDGSTSDITVRVIDAAGVFVTGDIVVNAPTTSAESQPSIAALSSGGFVVTWTNTAGSDGSVNGTYAQIFDASGVPQGDEFLVNETTANQQDNSHVVGVPGGGFVVVYRDTNGVDGSGQGILAQQFDANGNRVDGQIVVNTETSSTQNAPAIDVLANGGVVITWTSATSGTAGDGSADGVFSQIFGDPADFDLAGRPILQGFNSEVIFDENTLNIGPQLLDANNAVALSDDNSSDFDGGFLRVDNVIVTRGYQDQVAPPDNFTQDNISLRQAQGITIVGTTVFVDGVQVGMIVNDGVAGNPFEIHLNSMATVGIVELLLENLSYRNTSDDPEPSRVLRVQVGDGDGGLSDPQLVTVKITSDVDGAAPVFGERQANTETNNEQSQSSVATLDDGGFVIVWRSYDQDAASTYGVYGQRFDANGNAVGGEFAVNTTTASSQYEPHVSSLNNGGFVVTWRDNGGADGSGNGVFMQRFNADGTQAGTETQVNTYFSSTQYQPKVTVLENGDFVVVWSSFNNTGAGGASYDVFAQIYAEDGTAIGTEFLVNSEVASNQDFPDVTALANGGFAVAWESASSGSAGDGSSTGTFYQVFADSAASYAPVGGELQANSFTSGAQDRSVIIGLTGGGFVIFWESAGQDGSGEGVFGQQYDAAGLPIGQEFRVNDQRISNQNEIDAAALSNGGYVVVFSDVNGTDGSGTGVFAQQYDANGNRIDGAIQVNTEFSSTQNDPAVSALANGGFVVSWSSATSASAGDGSSTGIFYQVFSNSAPVVTDVAAATDEDTNLVFDSAIFADGFADAEGQSLAEIRIDVLPSTGSLTFNGSPVAPGQVVTVAELDAGALVYIPPADFNGNADFGWTGSDGSSFAATIALTNITVAPVNDPVGLQGIADQTVSEGSNLNINMVLGDPDNDTYTVTVNYGEGDGDVTFNTSSKTPGLFNTFENEGTYTVNVSVDDNAGSVESTSFSVTVENAAPFADNEFLSTDEDTASTNINVLVGDSDPGGDPLQITAINGQVYTPGTTVLLPSGASVTIAANGDLTYDPSTSGSLQSLASGQTGNDSFTYTITDDGGLSDTATVSVSVSGLDDNVTAQDDAFTVDEDSALSGSVFADNGNGPDVDPEGDALSIISVNNNAGLVNAPFVVNGGGVLQINADGTISFDAMGQYDELNVGDTRDINFSYIVEEDGSNLTASANGTITITGVNDGPVAQDDTRSTTFETAINIDVDANDFDVDIGDTFSITSVGVPGNGGAVLEADGTITYTPDNGFTGTDSFTYEITDANGGTATATVTVNVQGSNAPSAQNDLLSTDEETAITGSLFADNGNGPDTDPEGDDFSVTAVNGLPANVGSQITLASGALLTVNGDGSYSYDPNGQFEDQALGTSVNDVFTYTITDINGGTDTATVTISVNGVNDAPTVVPGTMNAAEDGSAVNLNLATLGDDVDNDDTGASLTYAVTNAPAEGSALISGTQLNFDPGSDFQDLSVGETRDVVVGVTATDSNGASSGEADITVTVLGVNDDPTLAAGLMTATEDGAAVMLDLATLGDDVDSEDDGSTLTYAVVGDPSEGTAGISGTELTFDPGSDFQDLNEGETRDVTITVEATDAQGASVTNDVTVTVTGVNDDPTLAAGAADAVEDGAPVTVDLAALGDDADAEDDGATLTYAILTQPSEGSASITGTTLDFDPGGDFQDLSEGETRDVTVTVQATDARGATVTNEVTITVTGVNDAPTLDAGTMAADEDGGAVSLDLSALGDDIDSEDDGTTLGYAVTGQPSEGSASITGTTLDFDPGSDFQDLNEGETRDVTITVEATDAQGATVSNDVTVTVTGVNDDPTLAAGTLNATEDGAIESLDLATLGDDADGEDDGKTLTYAVTGQPSEGSASITGTTLDFDPGADFQDLSAGETRDVTVTIEATDAQGATVSNDVTVTVTGINDDPTLAAGTLNATEDGAAVMLDLAALGDDIDSEDDGSSLSYAVVGAPAEGSASVSGTMLTFAPGSGFQDLAAGATRDVTITIEATDAQGARVTNDVTVTVTGVNDDPDANDDTASTGFNTPVTISVLANDADVDQGDTLSVTSVGTPSNGTADLNADGTITYTPDAGFGGTDSFTYAISDGQGGTSTATVNVTVTSNNAPVAVDDGATTDQDTPILGDVLADNGNGADFDPDGDAFDVIAVNGNAADIGNAIVLGSGAILTLNSDGTFDYDPNGAFDALSAGSSVEDSFAYTLADTNGLQDTATVTINIDGLNDAPTLVSGSATATEDGSVVTIDLAALGSDVDDEDDGASLTYALIGGQPSEGSVTLTGTSLSFDPGSDFQDLGTGESRDVTVDVQATDAQGATSGIQTMTFTVNGVNDAPEITSGDSYQIDENETAVGDVVATDVDGTVSYAISGGDDALLFAIDANSGALTFIAAPDFETPGDADGDNFYEVEVSASDGEVADVETITVQVMDVDEGPSLNTITGTAGRDYLIGTAGDDHFIFNGGYGDVAVGRGGADVFDVAAHLTNSAVDVTRIADWSDDDTLVGIDMTDINLATVRSGDTFLRFNYGPDNDMLVITGDVSGGLADIFDLAVT